MQTFHILEGDILKNFNEDMDNLLDFLSREEITFNQSSN